MTALELLPARCYQETVVHTGFDPEAEFTLPRVPHVEPGPVRPELAIVPQQTKTPKVTKSLKRGRRR